MQLNAVVLGASGYGGGELLRWLSQHPNVASIRGTSRSFAGRPFSDAHPNLRALVDGIFDAVVDWKDVARGDRLVVFSALPHGELAKALPSLEGEWREAEIDEQLVVIDLSADFRINDTGFVYGLPEWNRAEIVGANRIASPGCFATALQLALLPMRGLDLGLIAATAVTGSSGSGTSAIEGTHHPTRANDFRAYKILTHQHLGEVKMAMTACDISGHFAFVPQSGSFVRGIFATLQFKMPSGVSPAELEERLEQTFRDCPFVRIVEGSPRVTAVAGSNFADISVAADEHSAVVMVALDNLGKGMASQAVQSMNLSLGLAETTGLWQAGRYPG